MVASHLAADWVMHFGRTCLTPTQSLPVMYVYSRRECGKDVVVQEMQEMHERWQGKVDKVLLLYDVEYQHELGDI